MELYSIRSVRIPNWHPPSLPLAWSQISSSNLVLIKNQHLLQDVTMVSLRHMVVYRYVDRVIALMLLLVVVLVVLWEVDS